MKERIVVRLSRKGQHAHTFSGSVHDIGTEISVTRFVENFWTSGNDHSSLAVLGIPTFGGSPTPRRKIGLHHGPGSSESRVFSSSLKSPSKVKTKAQRSLIFITNLVGSIPPRSTIITINCRRLQLDRNTIKMRVHTRHAKPRCVQETIVIAV